MADIWIFILTIFSLLLLVLLYFLHKHYISTNGASLADTSKKVDHHTEDDTICTNIPLNQEPQRPIKAERKYRKKSQDPAQTRDDQGVTEKRNEARRQKELGDGKEKNDFGRNFIEEFDKRDARRKQLKKENEEKLKSLLNWSSPFSDGIAQKNSSDKEKYKRVSFVDRDLPRIKKEPAVAEYRAEPGQEEFFKLKENPAQSKVKEKSSPAGQEVRKIINFVAITSREVAPSYKPRNKLNLTSVSGSGSDTIKQPQRVERRRRVPTPTPRKKVKVNNPEVLECSDHVENVEDIDLDVAEEMRAAVKVADKLGLASVSLVDTSFNFEKEPPRPSSLEFTPAKRNFITDRLFAGNIYVGENCQREQEEQDMEERKEEERRGERCSSWRESYQRKMSC